mgnify:CR=1 FL=1
MIALSAVQSGDFDAVIIEDQLPLMVPSRLIKELVSVKQGIPVISVVRGNERRKELLDDFGLGLFSYFEPDKHSGEELFEMLSSAKRFQDFKKEVPREKLNLDYFEHHTKSFSYYFELHSRVHMPTYYTYLCFYDCY